MRGQFTITEELIYYNQLDWDVFDFLYYYLHNVTINSEEKVRQTINWIAYIRKDGIYKFVYADQTEKISQKYIDSYKRDGWTVNSNFIPTVVS